MIGKRSIYKLFLALSLSIISLLVLPLYSFKCTHIDFGTINTWFVLFEDGSSIIIMDKLLINIVVLSVIWLILCLWYQPRQKMVMILSMIALVLCALFYTQNFLRGKYIISNDLVNYHFVPSNNYQGVAPFFQVPDISCQN